MSLLQIDSSSIDSFILTLIYIVCLRLSWSTELYNLTVSKSVDLTITHATNTVSQRFTFLKINYSNSELTVYLSITLNFFFKK